MLLGLSAGSSVPVVAGIVALLGAFFGLGKASGLAILQEWNFARFVAFAVVVLVATPARLYDRLDEWLAPSFRTQWEALRDGGLSEEQAKAAALQRRYGTPPKDSK
jgi:hypothetical protein